MAKINPREFSWTAPTQNTDGSPIVGELSYRMNLDGSPFLDFPGTLNPDGRYYQVTDNMNLPDGAHVVTLQAFYVDSPELISDPSNALDIIVGVTQPEVPLDFLAS